MAALAIASQKMSFIEHLEELRRRLIWSVAFVAIAFAGCWAFAGDLYDIARRPIDANAAVTLAIARPQDIVGLNIKVTLVAAIFLSAPLVLLQAWLFISPGLYEHERRYALPFVLSASLLFIAGGAFGYFVAFPRRCSSSSRGLPSRTSCRSSTPASTSICSSPSSWRWVRCSRSPQ
jgi:sec-independent protein translocase protein TatC